MKKIAVFCGASQGFNSIYMDIARELGVYFAENNIGLVYGGGKMGLMGAIADAVHENKGHTIGVIPEMLKHEEIVHEKVSKLIVTETMSDRKIEISKYADGYIALSGGFGTLDEIFEALTMGQLGIEKKPIGFLNTNGFYNPLLEQLDLMVREGFLHQKTRDMALVSDTIEELIEKMKAYKPERVSKIIDTTVRDEKH